MSPRESLLSVDATGAGPFVVATGPRATVITLSGEFDIATVREVGSAVDALLATNPTDVVMDMAGLEFIDSSGIALLLRIYTQVVKEACGSLRVANPSDAARRTFELSGLTEAFGFDTIADLGDEH